MLPLQKIKAGEAKPECGAAWRGARVVSWRGEAWRGEAWRGEARRGVRARARVWRKSSNTSRPKTLLKAH